MSKIPAFSLFAQGNASSPETGGNSTPGGGVINIRKKPTESFGIGGLNIHGGGNNWLVKFKACL